MHAAADEPTLAQGLEELGVRASDAQLAALAGYADLTRKWNRKFNIVSRKDMDRFVTRHLLDSLSALPWLQARRCLDLGSGAGLPGIPLAIMAPQMQVTLLERSEKKARFLAHVVRELPVPNAQVVINDAKDYRPQRGYGVLVSRAVAPAAKLWAMGQHLLADRGRMVLHAAVGSQSLRPGLPAQVQARSVAVSVPGLAEPHQLLVLERHSTQN